MSTPTTTQVLEQLERLAGEAPTRLGDPEQLWYQGRRRQRARWAGTAAALVVLAVLGAVAVPRALQRTPDRVAANPDAELRLPDVIRQPEEWEPAFPSAPGPLVAAGLGTRGSWWSSRAALWGVSATTGESRFLDLPDVAWAGGPALSTDGRRLAYWFTDEDVEAHPGTLEPGGTRPLPPAGVAVVDLDSGDIERWEAEAPHGVTSEGLAWADDVLWWSARTLPVGEDDIRSWRRTHTWDVGTDQRRVVEKGTAARDLFLSAVGPATGGFVVDDYLRLHVVQGDRVARTLKLDTEIGGRYGGPALSPDGARVAAVLPYVRDRDGVGGEEAPVAVSRADGRMTDFTRVGDVSSAAVLGWRSEDEVVIETRTGTVNEPVHTVSVVDVRTADVTTLLEFDGNIPSFAADAWSAEVIEAPDAPRAPDPRVVGALVLMVGAFVVTLANRLRRRRAGA